MKIEITHVCPKDIKWKYYKKFTDTAYDYPTVQIAEFENRLYIKHTPCMYLRRQKVKPFYVVVQNYMTLEYHHILNFALDNNIDSRHLRDAVLDFYITKIRNWEL